MKMQIYTYMCDNRVINLDYMRTAVTWDSLSTWSENVSRYFLYPFITEIIGSTVIYVGTILYRHLLPVIYARHHSLQQRHISYYCSVLNLFVSRFFSMESLIPLPRLVPSRLLELTTVGSQYRQFKKKTPCTLFRYKSVITAPSVDKICNYLWSHCIWILRLSK